MAKLGLFYLSSKSSQGGGFYQILNNLSPIYRLTIFWDGQTHPGKPGYDWDNSEWPNFSTRLQI